MSLITPSSGKQCCIKVSYFIYGLLALDFKRWKTTNNCIFTVHFTLLPDRTLKQMVSIQMKMRYKSDFY